MNKSQQKIEDSTEGRIAAFDVGGSRIGVATARTDVKLAKPFDTFLNDGQIWQKIDEFLNKEEITLAIIGLPRGLDGQETEQTRITRSFAEEFKRRFSQPIVFQDEAVTSRQAVAELEQTGKRYNRSMVDAVAATIILEDYLRKQG